MHSTLLVGCYDWDAQRLPKEEFQARIAALWQRLPAQCEAVAVYGDRRSNAALAYFSHLVPKLRDAVLLLGRSGETRLLVSGGANAMPPAARQTWLGTVEPLSDLGKALAQWKETVKAPVALVGADGVRMAVHRAVLEAIDEPLSRQAAEAVRVQMRSKSPRELAEIRRGCAMLEAMCAALRRAQRAGKGVTECLAETEHEAVRLDAGEVRTLFSVDGGKTLRPFVTPITASVDPLQAYCAVRAGGYWVEGFVQTSKGSSAAAGVAAAALKKLIAAAKPGVAARELSTLLRHEIGTLQEHPLTSGRLLQAIGLSLDNASGTVEDEALQPGGVYSVRAGVSDGQQHAMLSAVVAVNGRGNEILWSAA